MKHLSLLLDNLALSCYSVNICDGEESQCQKDEEGARLDCPWNRIFQQASKDQHKPHLLEVLSIHFSCLLTDYPYFTEIIKFTKAAESSKGVGWLTSS